MTKFKNKIDPADVAFRLADVMECSDYTVRLMEYDEDMEMTKILIETNTFDEAFKTQVATAGKDWLQRHLLNDDYQRFWYNEAGLSKHGRHEVDAELAQVVGLSRKGVNILVVETDATVQAERFIGVGFPKGDDTEHRVKAWEKLYDGTDEFPGEDDTI
jgi:hypothetical protein